jgi:hypothetical protein
LLLLALFLIALGPAVSRSQDTFTVMFEGPPYLRTNSGIITHYYSENGMSFTGDFARSSPGSPFTPNNGTSFIADGPGLVFSGNYFGLLSVDLAAYSTVVPNLDITFVGFRPDGSTIVTNFSGTGIVWHTYVFGPEWSTSLTRVAVSNYTWSMDNLVVATSTPGDFEYLVGSNSVSVWRYKGTAQSVTIPATYLGLPVAGIDYPGFRRSAVTNATLPETIAEIGGNVFEGCTNLESIGPLPNLTSVGGAAFWGCAQLRDLVLPATVTNIGWSAFYGCSSLPNANISGNVRRIYDNTFDGCSSVTNISLGSGITNIGRSAFASCESLSKIIIPERVTRIEAGAFYYCTLLDGIHIPTNVTYIGDSAFEGCVNIPGITVSAGVSNIGKRAFTDCTSLSGISVDAANTNYCSIDGVLFSKDQAILMQCPGAVAGAFAIPGTVQRIDEAAFYGCQELAAVTIPNSVTNLGAWAFHSCAALTNIAIPPSILTIGPVAFRDCFSLTAIAVDDLNPAYSSLDGVLFDKKRAALIQYPAGKTGNYIIPDSVNSISDWAFASNLGLEKVTIGTQVTAIGEYAFARCSNLRTVFFTAKPPTYAGAGLFLGNDQASVYYLPGKTGWNTNFAGLPAILWNSQIKLNPAAAAGLTNGFQFSITGSSNLVAVVEACTSLRNPVWVPLATNSLAGGPAQFKDLEWTNYPARFYRLTPL